MNFNNFIAIVKYVILNNYCNFEGRASRPEYWWFFLFNFVVGLILSLLGQLGTIFVILSYIYSLAVLLPGLGVCIRRLHDINKSGWAILIAFVPVVGAIILIYWLAKAGDLTENQYGPVPQTPSADTVG